MAEILRCGSCDFKTMDRAAARSHTHAQFFIEDWPGLAQMRKARETGTYVGVYQAQDAGLESDVEAGRWATVCEEHSSLVLHATKTAALSFASVPTQWCEDCREENAA